MSLGWDMGLQCEHPDAPCERDCECGCDSCEEERAQKEHWDRYCPECRHSPCSCDEQYEAAKERELEREYERIMQINKGYCHGE